MTDRTDTCAQVATRAVPTTTKDRTATTVLAEVAAFSNEFVSLDYIYVVDEDRLIGVVSLHELMSKPPTTLMGDVMETKLAYVHASTDREVAAHLALAENIKAVPVLDDEHRLLGVITADSILQILQSEHTEDILTYAGINVSADERIAQFTLRQHLGSRLPWLVLGLTGGIFAAFVVERFSHTLESELALAAFIPAIVYIADSVGSQTQMVYVRSLTNRSKVSLRVRLQSELLIATLVGLTLSALIALVSWFWLANQAVTTILATSVLITVYFSVIVAIALPWSFNRLGKDPALATGPLATVIRDVSSLAIYFLIALLVL